MRPKIKILGRNFREKGVSHEKETHRTSCCFFFTLVVAFIVKQLGIIPTISTVDDFVTVLFGTISAAATLGTVAAEIVIFFTK